MKTANAALISHLQTATQFLWADLYSITLLNGTVLNFTSLDRDVFASPTNYLSTGVKVSRSNIKTGLGLAVDKVKLTLLADGNLIAFSTVPLLQAAVAGLLDGAPITISRQFFSSFSSAADPNLRLVLWAGTIGEVVASRTQLELACADNLEPLNVQIPRNVVQSPCYHTLYDAGCTLSKAGFSEALAVLAGGNSLNVASGSAKASGYYDLGQMAWTSGKNNGLVSTVKSFAGGTFTLHVPPIFPVTAGDLFTASAGCDKLQATCLAKFNNLLNFGGFPYVPQPETGA